MSQKRITVFSSYTRGHAIATRGECSSPSGACLQNNFRSLNRATVVIKRASNHRRLPIVMHIILAVWEFQKTRQTKNSTIREEVVVYGTSIKINSSIWFKKYGSYGTQNLHTSVILEDFAPACPCSALPSSHTSKGRGVPQHVCQPGRFHTAPALCYAPSTLATSFLCGASPPFSPWYLLFPTLYTSTHHFMYSQKHTV